VRTLSDPLVSGSEELEDWQLSGEGAELELCAEGEPAHSVTPGGEADGFDQLCRARGRATIDGTEIEVDSLGVRAARSLIDLRAYESIRDVSAWFAPDEGIALVALRPRRARGHSRDEIAAAVLDPAGARTVTDPRISTTYAEDGVPVRAGLELWIGDDGEQYSRRAAGEAVGAGALAADQDLELRAELFRWHSRGRDGAGVYLLARPR
jgi:hypothetical protein